LKMVTGLIVGLMDDNSRREQMQTALAKWHAPNAAEQIAETMLKLIAQETERAGASAHGVKSGCGCGGEHRAELRSKTTA
jgi:hypothetical protein